MLVVPAKKLSSRHQPVFAAVHVIECVAHLLLRDRRVLGVQEGTELVKAQVPRSIHVDFFKSFRI